MKNGRSLLVLIFCTSLLSVRAQSIERSVIASSGGQGQSATAQLSWTCGESTILTLQSPTNMLSQGFQQLNPIQVTGFPDAYSSSIAFSVFPVPCADHLDIQIFRSSGKVVSWILINSIGAQIKSGKITDPLGHIDMSDLQSGTYFLRMTEDQTGYLKTFSIIKSK
jgi:hypothetical protein